MLPPCAVDRRSRNPLYYYYYQQAGRQTQHVTARDGVRGRRGWDKTEECLGVNGRQLFARVDCDLKE